MTTHAMDEAETLCKRMGIMVNGEFVCLGSSNEIKEKYGFGYEIDVRIKPITQEEMKNLLDKYQYDKKFQITQKNLKENLIKLNKLNYYEQLKEGKLGEKLIKEIEINGYIYITNLLSFIHFNKNALKLISKAKKDFNEIIFTEFIDNNFLFKIKKEENGKSIGYLFGLFENSKDDCYVTEYSIQQTSLEQIFNQFSRKQKKEGISENLEDKKTEIFVDDELINKLTE